MLLRMIHKYIFLFLSSLSVMIRFQGQGVIHFFFLQRSVWRLVVEVVVAMEESYLEVD